MAQNIIFMSFVLRQINKRQGIGTEFLKCVEEYVKRLNVTHIFLQTERTVPAYEFYKKNGFVELNEHVSLFKEFN